VYEALLASLPTGLATGLGALPFVFVKQLPRRAYDGVLGLGAGLMLAAATLGLLGEAIAGVRTPAGLDLPRLGLVACGFLAGVVLAVIMDRLIPHGHARGHPQHIGHEVHDDHDHRPPPNSKRRYLVVGAISIHRLPEGLAIGAGFAAPDHRLGWLLAIAVGIQNVCEGIVMGAPLRQGGMSPARSLLVVSATGMMIPVGAIIGQGLSEVAIAALPFVLALAGGTLIYVTSNEIIPESHSHGHEGTASAGFITGFLLTMLLDALIH
jgi:ZIP family zinc transporter